MRTGSSLFSLLALASGALAKVEYVGVAIPGIDFGCDIDGSWKPAYDPIRIPLKQYGGSDGAAQMKHFVKDSGLNVFRLPTPWQYITNSKIGDLDSTLFGRYDELMQACFDTGAYCMIDLHNFARYDGGIIGQGGPSNTEFANLWSQIAKKYAKEDKVIFGLMNEPHDVDVNLWADTCQAAVTAIRKAGATSQIILLPGTNFASVETFVSSGSADALAAITNPDGSKDGLIMDVHKYLDINNSGTHEECTTDNVDAFNSTAAWLRKNKRQAIVSESGASMSDSCMEKFCAQNAAINENDDVYIGFVGWGAGSFDLDYIMSLVPTGSAGSYEDNKLMKECIIKPLIKNAKADATTSTSATKATKTSHSSTATSTDDSAKSTDRVFKEEDPSSTSAGVASSTASANADSAASSRSVQSLAAGAVAGAALFFLCI